jgi:hypothetical protein
MIFTHLLIIRLSALSTKCRRGFNRSFVCTYHPTQIQTAFICNDKKHQNLTHFLKIIFISNFVKRREADNKKEARLQPLFLLVVFIGFEV